MNWSRYRQNKGLPYLKTVEFSVRHTVVFNVSVHYKGESHPVSITANMQGFVTTIISSKIFANYPRLSILLYDYLLPLDFKLWIFVFRTVESATEAIICWQNGKVFYTRSRTSEPDTIHNHIVTRRSSLIQVWKIEIDQAPKEKDWNLIDWNTVNRGPISPFLEHRTNQLS